MNSTKLFSRLLLPFVIIIGIGLALATAVPAKAVVVFSNLSASDGTTSTIRPMTRRAAGFTIPKTNDFTLNSVTLQLANIGSSARAVTVEIRSDANNSPGELMQTLDTVALEANTASATYTTAPSVPLVLGAGKTYWLVVYATNNSQWIGSAPAQPPSGLFTFVGYQSSLDSGATWSNSKSPQIKLYIDASAPGLPTNTVTPTFTPSNTPMPTNTPTATMTRTPRPTRTPLPSTTPRPTRTPRNTSTPVPTKTTTNTATKAALFTNTPEQTADVTGTVEATTESLSAFDLIGTAEATAEPMSTAEPLSGCQLTTIVVSRLRQAPSLTSQTLAGVPAQTTLSALAFENGWYQVSYQGIQAWINASVVSWRGTCGQ